MKSITIYFNTAEMLFIKVSTIAIKTHLPVDYKFVYLGNIIIWSSGTDGLFEYTFNIGLIFELLLSQETMKVLDKVVGDRKKKAWGIS